MHWNLMNDEQFEPVKLLKLKCRRVDQIIQTFCKIGSPLKLGPPPLFNLYNFKTLKKLLWIMRNALISNEWPWIWVHKTFKIQIQKRGPKNSNFLQNWFPQKLGTPVQFVEISTLWENHCWIMHNALKSNEWRTIWVRKTFKIEIQKGGKLVPHRK